MLFINYMGIGANESFGNYGLITHMPNKGNNNFNPKLNQYPKLLNPFKVLGTNNFNNLKKIFKDKMKGNTNPEIRLAYDVLVNSDDYIIDENNDFYVKNEKIFYYAHIGSIDGIKYCLNQNINLLEKKDKLGRTIFYIAARNGYYNLCKYLINVGANINATQAQGNTPLEGAYFYGHDSIVKLIEEENKKKNIKLSKNENRKDEIFQYNINDFDKILKKNCHPNPDYFNFFKEKHSSTSFNHISIFDKNNYNNYKHIFN